MNPSKEFFVKGIVRFPEVEPRYAGTTASEVKPLNARTQTARLSSLFRALPSLLVLGMSLWSAVGSESAPSSPGNPEWVAAMLAKRASLRLGDPGTGMEFTQSPWFTSGPLKAASFSDALFPETGVNLEATAGNRKLWRTQKYRDGVVNPLKSGDGTSTYLYRTLVAKTGGKLPIGLGSDDGIEFWFNAEKLVSDDVPRGVGADQNRVDVNVRPGTNTVLLKIYNRTGDCGFYYSAGRSLSGSVAMLEQKYPRETRLFSKYASLDNWLQNPDDTAIESEAIAALLKVLQGTAAERQKLEQLVQAKTPSESPEWLNLLLSLATRAEEFDRARAELETINLASLRLAVNDLTASFAGKYQQGPEILKELEVFEQSLPSLKQALAKGDPHSLDAIAHFQALRRKALLGNPLLDFAQILLIKRSEQNLCLPQNWQGNSSMDSHTVNELATLSIAEASAPLKTLYRPAENRFVGDVDLNFDSDKLLFSSIGTHQRWQVFELTLDGAKVRQVTPADETDIDSYDPMYLPDGRIIFDSTSTFQGVPCVGGGDYVANLHRMNPDGTGIRRLCFDQDNDWCPTMLPNGRVLYLRWEYTDSAHYFSRVLMSMNPDGTGQTEFYGSGSYWPNGTFYARPLPGSGSKFVGIVSGHHGVPRMGEMVIFDAAKGRQEDSGAIQRISQYGKPVRGIIKDELVNDSWPKFLHPYPLSDKYFLAACKPNPQALWGVYLVDIFDNMLLLKEEPGFALLEPLPLRKTPRPPVLEDKVNLAAKTATVFVQDIYAGKGLEGVPRGTVKSLRLLQYEYSYRNQGGHYFVGMEGGWDIRRLIGTVPVYDDGSASFHIPANTPVAIQPLDDQGQALQQMRSWFVGMPGEYVSCVGCHERQNSSAPVHVADAALHQPADPKPWYGPKRGFGFLREVQPVLDRYCAGCHNAKGTPPNLADATIIPTSGGISPLPQSYVELHPWVRRNGPEGDYHTLTPLEFHADTSRLVQMLRKGHYNVTLDKEAWDRLITWVDINVPAYGTYHEIQKIPSNFEKRRSESRKKYSLVDEDIEAIPTVAKATLPFVQPPPMPARPAPAPAPGWPFGTEKARELQASSGAAELNLDLGNGMQMRLNRIPAGEFVMGDVQGERDEYPASAVRIAKAFWMGTTEVSLEQYQQFDPNHRNGYYDMHYKDQVKPGYLMDFPRKPVIRVSWHQASAFCQWLSKRTGRKVTLPTEAQWEWACRAGTASPMFYGDLNSDFSRYANLADASIAQLAVSGVDPQPISNPDRFWDFVPKEGRFNDGVLHLADCGNYQPNPWGLHDMIGNVAEWTLDNYRPYPYAAAVGPAASGSDSPKAVRGGSWAERPKESRAASRIAYPAWQRVYNVGFRVIVTDEEPAAKVAASR